MFTSELPTTIQAIRELLSQHHYDLTPKVIQQVRNAFSHFESSDISILLDIAKASHAASLHAELSSIQPWLFTQQTLMQSSEPAFAHHVMQSLSVKNEKVIELCTGSGMHAFQAHNLGALDIRTHDIDPNIVSLFKLNAANHNVKVHAECMDGLSVEISSQDVMFADPSRRSSGLMRTSLTGTYIPDLQSIINKARNALRAAIKIAPGERIEGPFTREFLGSGKECREQILWINTDAIDGSVTLVDKAKSFIPSNQSLLPELVHKETLRSYSMLIEPHAALIRGNLSCMYAEQHISVFDRSIAYGLSNEMQDSDWFSHFRLLHVERYARKRLQDWIDANAWNAQTEIKKRGFPIEPDILRKQITFHRDSDKKGVILLTRIQDEHMMFFCERITSVFGGE